MVDLLKTEKCYFLTGGVCFLYPDIQNWKTQRKVEKITEAFKESYNWQMKKIQEKVMIKIERNKQQKKNLQ